MTRARVALRASFTFGLSLLGVGCPTTYVSLGDTKSNDRGAAAIGGAGAVGGMGGVAGTGFAGAYDAVAGSAGTGVHGACSPTERTLSDCAPYQQVNDVYNHNACLNRGDGVDGMFADQCEGYAPCSYQHEGCIYYYSGGAAGAGNTGCAGSPAEEAWLMDCGGLGYYGPDILSGAAGQAGFGVGGAAGITGGMGGAGGVVGGSGAGMGGVGGTTGGSGGMAGMTISGAGGMSGAGGVGGAAGASGGAGVTGGEGGGG